EFGGSGSGLMKCTTTTHCGGPERRSYSMKSTPLRLGCARMSARRCGSTQTIVAEGSRVVLTRSPWSGRTRVGEGVDSAVAGAALGVLDQDLQSLVDRVDRHV